MRRRGKRREPKILTDNYSILLTPVVVSLQKLNEETYSSQAKASNYRDNNPTEDISNLNNKQPCLRESMDGTCADDEYACDDRSIFQDPGWQKDVSDVLSTILEDGGTCPSEWPNDEFKPTSEVLDTNIKNESSKITVSLSDSSKETKANLNLNLPPYPEIDDETTNIDDDDDDAGNASDATITETAENITDELEKLDSEIAADDNPNPLLSSGVKSPTEIHSDTAMTEDPDSEYTDKSKNRKVSALSVYAEVEDAVVINVTCKRFKRRRIRRSDSEDQIVISPIKVGRRKKSRGNLGNETTELIHKEVKEVVDDILFHVSYQTNETQQNDSWMSENGMVEELLKEFCDSNGYDHNDFSNVTCVLDFDGHIVNESDNENIPSQRKCYKRKFPQEMDSIFRKKRKRKMSHGEVIKKFFTRSAARRLQYTTDSNGDTIVVEEGESDVSDSEDICKEITVPNGKVALEVTEEVPETVTKDPIVEQLNNISVNDEDEVDVVTIDDDDSKPSEEEEPKAGNGIQSVVETNASPEGNQTGTVDENQSTRDIYHMQKEQLDTSKIYGVSKFRHRHHMLQSLKEKAKRPVEADAPLDLRIKDIADGISSAKTKTPIQMVHPQVNTSLMPKKVWCARMDCFTSGDALSLVSKSPEERIRGCPANTPKQDLSTIEQKKIQEAEAESILRTLLLEASDAGAVDVACEAKRNGEISLNIPRVPTFSDKDNTKIPEHKDTLNRMKEVLNHGTPRLKSSPAPSTDSSLKIKPTETESASDMDKLQDPLRIKEEIKKLKNEIVHLEMIAEQKEKERIAIICFKKCKEEILKHIENSRVNILLQKEGSVDKEGVKSQSAIHSKLSLHALLNYAKNKMIDAHRTNGMCHSNHRETCLVRPIVSHENRKTSIGTESLPSVEALVAKATENYGVNFDNIPEEKMNSLNRQSLEHTRRLAEIQHSTYQCCSDPIWRNAALYGFTHSPSYCNNSFHTALSLTNKPSVDQEHADHIKACWKYGSISDYSNKEKHHNDKLKNDQHKTETSRDTKILYHPTATVPPVTWTHRTYCKPNTVINSKTTEASSSSRMSQITPAQSSAYLGSTIGRYGNLNLSSQSYYPSHNYGLPTPCWNGYPSSQLSHRHQTSENEMPSKIRNENQRWMDRPCPPYLSPYVPPRGNSTSPC